MDCKKAEDAMMQYMEKTIKPADAKALAIHLLTCDSCREYFTALDMTMEALDEGAVAFTEAPSGFAEAVMEKVSALPVYHEKPKKVRNYNFAIRVAGGLCSVATGLALIIISRMAPSGELAGTLASIGAWFDGITAQITQGGISSFFNNVMASAPNLGIYALVIAVVISALLFTLQRGDNVKA